MKDKSIKCILLLVVLAAVCGTIYLNYKYTPPAESIKTFNRASFARCIRDYIPEVKTIDEKDYLAYDTIVYKVKTLKTMLASVEEHLDKESLDVLEKECNEACLRKISKYSEHTFSRAWKLNDYYRVKSLYDDTNFVYGEPFTSKKNALDKFRKLTHDIQNIKPKEDKYEWNWDKTKEIFSGCQDFDFKPLEKFADLDVYRERIDVYDTKRIIHDTHYKWLNGLVDGIYAKKQTFGPFSDKLFETLHVTPISNAIDNYDNHAKETYGQKHDTEDMKGHVNKYKL